MGKKIEYIFELKLKYLKFFNLHGVMPPYNFFPKMDYWGGHDFGEYGSLYKKNEKY